MFDRALDALIRQLEKQKFAATERPRSRRQGPRGRARKTTRARHVPAEVRRAVWERDQGRCSSVRGEGAAERRLLEFDHVEPVARGGRATIDGMRLRGRAHNQYEAERAFGADFMSRKREEARRAAVQTLEARVTAFAASTANTSNGGP